MLKSDKMGAIHLREDGKWAFTPHRIRTDATVFPCPNCEFCEAHKTWDTTRYIKAKNSLINKDACEECFKKSDNGFEAGYFDEGEYTCGLCEQEQDKEYSICCEACGLLTCEDCLKSGSSRFVCYACEPPLDNDDYKFCENCCEIHHYADKCRSLKW